MNLAKQLDTLIENDARDAKEIAAAASVSAGSLSNWRSGERSPGAEREREERQHRLDAWYRVPE